MPTVLGAGGRFVVERRLGAGAFGVVYAARDRRTGRLIALKVLRDVGETAARRLQREFAVLAELRHASLVRLHELFHDEGQWFFTMDLVRGKDFVSFVRADAEPGITGGRGRLPMAFGQPIHEASAYSMCTPSGLDRLRRLLGQLGGALEVLHGAGLVHRDLRPENVRVTPDGRLVVLDYGLTVRALDATEPDVNRDVLTRWVGTAAYMAPEQWDEAGASAASDWYAVGVLLFQAITGVLPFAGSAHEVFVRKRTVGAPRLSSVVAHVPRDLDELAAELLHIEPTRRPSGCEVVSRLGP
jgi:serine/threonine protein kinase